MQSHIKLFANVKHTIWKSKSLFNKNLKVESKFLKGKSRNEREFVDLQIRWILLDTVQGKNIEILKANFSNMIHVLIVCFNQCLSCWNIMKLFHFKKISLFECIWKGMHDAHNHQQIFSWCVNSKKADSVWHWLNSSLA
jgi:hypothetical protein